MTLDPECARDLPAIEGVRFRPISGVEDGDALCAVHAGRQARDAVDPLSILETFPSRDDLREALARAKAAGLENEWLVAQAADRAAGYGRIAVWQENDGMWVYLLLGWVLPEWRGRGIGTAILRWGEQAARRSASTRHPGEKFELAANASGTEPDAAALLAREGYRAGYTVLEMEWDLSTPLPALPLPAGIEARSAQPEHYPLIAACVGEAYKNEFAGGRFQEKFDPADFAAQIGAPKHDPSLWQVAWAEDTVAGQVLSRMTNGRAEIFEVSVHPAWRRRGLARALLTRALLCLRGRGAAGIRLHTVAEFRTRACDLYRSVGFRVLKEFPRYRKSP
jgi:mycothiol synthase